MKLFILLFGLAVVLVTTAIAADRVSPVILPSELPQICADPVHPVPVAPSNLLPGGNELDEYLGDTLWVGRTFQDVQHNAQVGRIIQYDPNDDVVHVTYTDLYQAGGVPRHVMYNRILFDTGDPTLEDDSYIVDGGDRAGFPTLAMCQNAVNPEPIPVYHGRMNSDQEFNTKTAAEYEIFRGLFVEFPFPWERDYQIIWPRSCMDGDSIVHVLSTTSGAPTYENWYTRLRFDGENNSFTITNNDGTPEMAHDIGEFISSEIACSPDGERVAMASLINRARLQGEEEPAWFDQNLYIWINEDYGNDWDWDLENAINVTDFIDPDPDLLPDSLAACQDTFRCYMDVSLFFDHNNTLHVAFSTLEYFYYYEVGYVTGQIWYWNEDDRDIVRVADGNFWNNTALGANNITIQRPCIYKDPETDWLYILYQQMGIPGDTLIEGENVGIGRDRSEAGYMNGELFITATTPDLNPGYYWFKGVNITNSRGISGAIPAGECAHERDPSIALNNDGDYLQIFYQLDLDAGVYLYATPEGVATDNPVIYQRILKEELRDSLNAQGEWVRGIPIHIDNRDFRNDPDGWEWGVRESEHGGVPGRFELTGVYPNPFNSSTRIAFEMQEPGFVTLKLYDLLGREVAALLERTMENGKYEVSFNADHLASGIYFVSLESGIQSATRKVVLIR